MYCTPTRMLCRAPASVRAPWGTSSSSSRVTFTSSEDVNVTREELLEGPQGARTEAGARHNIRVGVQYIESWLRGLGCVPLYNLMEDAATAEISRAQIWQWVHHRAPLEDGSVIDGERFARLVGEEMERIGREVGEKRYAHGKFAEARALFESLSTAPTFEEFLTLPAYEKL